MNFYLCVCTYERENSLRWAVEESRRVVSRINEKISALKQEPESSRGLVLTAMERWSFSVSCGNPVPRLWSVEPLTSVGKAPKTTWQLHPEPCVWQNRDTFIPSTPVSGWWHGPSGRLPQDWRTLWKTLPVIISISSVLFSSQMPALALHRWFCSDGPCLLYLRASLPSTVLIFFFTVPSGLFLIPSVFVLVFVEVTPFSTLVFAFSVY